MRTEIKKVKLTPAMVGSWKAPSFQRELRVNTNVELLVQKLVASDKPHLPGVITLSVFKDTTYLTDGQHRIKAFLLSELDSVSADVRTAYADSEAEMGEEFVQINSSIAALKPDHILKGLLGTSDGMRYIVKHHKNIVGFNQIRRREGSPVLSMSAFLRCWFASAKDVPRGGGVTAQGSVARFTLHEAETASEVLTACEIAWGMGPESYMLWNVLNLSLVMWVYRKMVLDSSNTATRSTKLTVNQFKLCLMQLAADDNYVGWLRGRSSNEFSQGPCYERIRRAFYKRYRAETGKAIIMPPVGILTGETKIQRSVGPVDYKKLGEQLKNFIFANEKGVPLGAVAAELEVSHDTARRVLQKAVDELWLVRVGTRGLAVYMKKTI